MHFVDFFDFVVIFSLRILKIRIGIIRNVLIYG